MTLEESYARHKAAYAGRRDWEWEDEGKWYALADYYSCTGEFTAADRAFIEREGLADVAADVLDYMREQTEGG